MLLQLQLGDCVERMSKMEENSVGVVVCDPPYGLEFQGIKWDHLDGVGDGGARFTADGMNKGFKALPAYSGSSNPLCLNCRGSRRGRDRVGFTICRCNNPDFPNVGKIQGDVMAAWHTGWLLEVHRVLQPGGTVKAFGGTRTFHRMAAAMEDVGFTDIHIEAWGYGSGFPKSHNVAVYLDKMLRFGQSREIHRHGVGNLNGKFAEAGVGFVSQSKGHEVTTPEALPWVGWGTALKPAWEPVLVGTKPG